MENRHDIFKSSDTILHYQTLGYISYLKDNIMDSETDQAVLLYVENEILIQLSTRPVLENAGFEVLTAANGKQALEIIADAVGHIDGLVTDVDLGPGPSGWNIARCARERLANIPIIYASSVREDEWMARGVPLSELVSKPFRPSRLASAISKLMASAGHPGHPTGVSSIST
jgi:CheY-like chemotaxis protein